MEGRISSRDVEERATVLRRRAREHGLVLPTVGTSMLPALPPGRDVRVDADRPARFGDVVAVVDDGGNIVVHRLVLSAGGRLRCLGDNRRNFDAAVPDSRLIGRVDERRRVLGHGRHAATIGLRTVLGRLRRRRSGGRR